MKRKEFFPGLGTTAACTLRLINGSHYSGETPERKQAEEQSRRYRFAMDSWFGSVKVAEHVKLMHKELQEDGTYTYFLCKEKGQNTSGHEVIGSVKTSISHYPLKKIKKIMKDWPSGAYLVLECTAPETGVRLVAIGYKYNAKKVLCFVMTKNAGSTAPGNQPYRAKYSDEHGNVKERLVPRPEILSVLFGDSDAIDSHNHCRQFRLGLETRWLTPNPWFRLDCTLIGQTVIDCYRAKKFHRHEPASRSATVAQFANALAWDCVNNFFSDATNNRRCNPTHFIPSSSQIQRMTSVPRSGMLIEDARTQMHSLVEKMSDQLTGSLRLTAEEEESIQDIPRLIGAGRESSGANEEVSFTSELTGGYGHNSLMPTAGISEMPIGCHDCVKFDKTGHDNRRECAICNMKTMYYCSNVECKATIYRHWTGTFLGVPLCLNKIRRGLEEYGGAENTRTCLEIHRDQVRKVKAAALKERYARRL